jgi:hypothetical protein
MADLNFLCLNCDFGDFGGIGIIGGIDVNNDNSSMVVDCVVYLSYDLSFRKSWYCVVRLVIMCFMNSSDNLCLMKTLLMNLSILPNSVFGLLVVFLRITC